MLIGSKKPVYFVSYLTAQFPIDFSIRQVRFRFRFLTIPKAIAASANSTAY
jgi:hypothetical protein